MDRYLVLLLFFCSSFSFSTAFRFIGISDLHISDSTALRNLRALLFTLRQIENAERVVLTGDLCGNAPEFLPRIKNILDNAQIVALPISGNHDDNYGRNPEWYLPSIGQLRYSANYKGWAFIMNWSQEQDTAWIKHCLDSIGPSTPLVFCQHYPLDGITRNILKTFPNIGLTVNGHVHGYSLGTVDGHPEFTLPSCFLNEAQIGYSYGVFQTTDSGTIQVQLKYLAKSSLRFPTDEVPSVTLNYLPDSIALNGVVAFTGTASDDIDVAKVEFSIDYGVWQKVSGVDNWTFLVDTRTLTDGNHLFSVRAVDNEGQECTAYAGMIRVVQNLPINPNLHTYQQGVNLYKGCTNASVSKQYTSTDDLECWIWGGGAQEYNEFYIRFDLGGDQALKGKYITSAKLTLFCNRENFESINTLIKAQYLVSVLKEGWDETMTWASRPTSPAWEGKYAYAPQEDMKGAWPKFTGRWMNPPQEVNIDLTSILPQIQNWIDSPSVNFGLLFAPVFGSQYNFSALRNNHSVASLRPKLTLETSDIPIALERQLEGVPRPALTVTPNPFSNSVRISLSGHSGNISVYDINGKRMNRLEINSNGVYDWQTSSVAPGIYFIHATGGNFQFKKKVMLIR